MDGPRFDAPTLVLSRAPSRRALLPLLGSALAFSVLGVVPAAARKKQKKKKTTFCLDGQTIKAAMSKKKKLLKRGATPGACPPVCTPACPGNACAVADGCGGTCACATGSLCLDGVCQACTVTCSGGGGACGLALQNALTGGGTVIACPGRYLGSFLMNAPDVTLIGAGEGEDPAANTILDANGSGRPVRVITGPATLRRLRITGGDTFSTGSGILNQGVLTVTACTVTNNHTDSSGGGIHNAVGPLTLIDCTVSANTAGNKGGGLFNDVATTSTLYGGAITGNTAGFGGGIFRESGTVNLNGVNVSGNSPDDCVNVPNC